MSSRLDSPSTTPIQDPPIDRLDVVATQGAYLFPPPRTPVFQKAYDDQFIVVLMAHLEAVITEKSWRHNMYDGAADDWAMGHTPPEIKEKYRASFKALEELDRMTVSTVSSGDDNGLNEGINKDKGDRDDIDARVGPETSVAAPDRPWRPRKRPRKADGLQTPPLSAESPLPTPHRRKRRRISEGEEERPAKKHIGFAQEVSAATEDFLPKTARQKGRKRRRTRDVGDAEKGDKGRPNKMRVITTARPSGSGVWMHRLRPRPRRPAA